MNVISRELVENYLYALEADEAEIQHAAEDYHRARARVDVALLRYTALRDFVTTALGKSPYAEGIQWPDTGHIDPATRGRFRFAGMKVGDAIVEVLRSRRESPTTADMMNSLLDDSVPVSALSLDEINKALSEGGLGFPDPVSARAVNAALMRTTGVERHVTKHGKTRYGLTHDEEEPGSDPSDVDDLPLE